MAQTFLPPAHDPYDPDADEHPFHDAAPMPEFKPGERDPSRNSEYNPNGRVVDGLPYDEDELAERENAGDPGARTERPTRQESRESRRPASPSSVKDSEEKGGGWFRADEEGNRFQRGRSRLRNGKAKLSGLGKNKIFIGGMVGGSSAIIVLIFALILIAGSLKIPNLAEHITTYAFARVLRQSVETDGKITNEKLAVDSLTQRGYDYAKNSYQGLRDNTWGKFDKYRPQKLMEAMKADDNLKLNYSAPNAVGRQQLKGVTLNNKSFLVENQGASRFIPGFSDVVKFKNGVTFSKNFSPALSEAIKANNVGTVVRGLTANQIRKEIGVGLIAWHVGNYKAKTEEKARLVQARELNKAVSDGKVDVPTTGPLKEAVENGEKSEQAVLEDDAKLKAALDNGGVSPDTERVIEKSVTSSNFEKGLAIANPAYALALSGCIIYDGSLTQSGPTINAHSEAQQREYYYVATAADQQKYGDTTGEAVGALNNQVGDIAVSNPEIRAAGGTPDTSNTVSGQAGASGDFSIFDAVLGAGSTGSDIGNLIGKGICPTMTNTGVAVGTAVILAAATFLTGGGAGAGVETANAALEAGTAGFTQRFVTGIVAKYGSEQAAQKAGAYAGKTAFIARDTAKSGIKVAGLTILAKMIVMNRMHSTTNGLEEDTELANNADSGGDQTAGAIEQRQYYGRPLSKGEVFETRAADAAFIKSQVQAEPFTQRYFAISNPDSLANKLAVTTASVFNHSFFSSFLSLGAKIFNPLGSVNHLFGTAFTPKAALAASGDLPNTNYGNVQWGYSEREMNVLRTDFTYRLLENKSLLEQSGEYDAIEAKYGQCFDGSKKIGDMLSEGLIVRDNKGNVDPDKGLCAPNHLAYDSTDSDFQPHMVFRWRVSHNYDNGMDQLNYQQEKTETAATSAADTNISDPAPTATGTVAQGSGPELAKKLLGYRSSGNYKCDNAGDCVDLQKVADGKTVAGSDGCTAQTIDPRVMQLLLYLIESGHFKIGTLALCGDHRADGPNGHQGGFAVDIGTINGTPINQNSPAAKNNTLKLDKFLNNNLPDSLKLRQQISYGYGRHYDAQIADTQQGTGSLCHSTCVSFFTQEVENAHTDHVHAGY